ncbi:MAG TPA: NAD(P)H-dependent oxidoreductase [Vicinamibacteria bacterium]|jgi:chromate reductase|nr:NAD(P)H-dependent oxidoreductase [Vicinamibacteria bacterium]
MADGEPHKDVIKVLGFAGSLRRGSLNRGLLRAAQELAPPGMTIEPYDLGTIPLYNYDLEERGDPQPVAEFKEAIRRAQALLISTPEYQHGVPGVLKNALDWASRPAGRSAMQGKPVAIMGASPGFTGTARAQTQLRQALTYTQNYAVLQPEVLVGRAHEKFDAEGHLTDARTREFVRKLLEGLWALARLLSPRP